MVQRLEGKTKAKAVLWAHSSSRGITLCVTAGGAGHFCQAEMMCKVFFSCLEFPKMQELELSGWEDSAHANEQERC